MIKSKKSLYVSLKDFLFDIGDLTKFSGSFFREVFRRPFEFNEFLKQSYEIGYRSLGLVGITGFILGLVLTLQTRPVLVEFGAEAWLPGMVALSIVREIGPVITALICAGKISSRIGAELGSMQVTEQIDAMEVSGTNPTKFLVATRVLATTIMVPLLVIYSDAIALLGSYIAVNIEGHISFHLFFVEVFRNLHFSDLIPAIIKTFFFGFGIGIIGCYKGYRTQKGTEGVGLAANSAVVIASLAIFVIDLLVVQMQQIINIF
ncbi:MAG: ABC transporter permease [Bacteroidales bacterium]|jgi:phospholipid/cholesterol/gamma-HCH transport system permease protein|nr:ABC transporter permease [Bacteroidales bacterium]